MNRLDRSVELFEQAQADGAAVSADTAKTFLNRGMARSAVGDWPSALDDFDQASRLLSQRPNAEDEPIPADSVLSEEIQTNVAITLLAMNDQSKALAKKLRCDAGFHLEMRERPAAARCRRIRPDRRSHRCRSSTIVSTLVGRGVLVSVSRGSLAAQNLSLQQNVKMSASRTHWRCA